MQHRLGVAVGLLGAFEDQLQGSLEGHAVVEVRRHRAVQRVALVLTIDHRRHALEAFDHLILRHHAMAHPVGHVLAGDAQGGAVFHQRDVVDVRNLGAADALFDPANHVAEDALRVVVQLVALLFLAPVGVANYSRAIPC